MPLAGFDERYSLKIIPGSHSYRHPKSEIINRTGQAMPYSDEYVQTVGCAVRPSLKRGQGILFHPDLLHGNAANLGNETRVSISFYSDTTTQHIQRNRRIDFAE